MNVLELNCCSARAPGCCALAAGTSAWPWRCTRRIRTTWTRTTGALLSPHVPRPARGHAWGAARVFAVVPATCLTKRRAGRGARARIVHVQPKALVVPVLTDAVSRLPARACPRVGPRPGAPCWRRWPPRRGRARNASRRRRRRRRRRGRWWWRSVTATTTTTTAAATRRWTRPQSKQAGLHTAVARPSVVWWDTWQGRC